MEQYDVLVIGGGHAGIEATLASARMGCKTLMVTLKRDTIGLMSCNPAIGGVGKGQLVKEIDCLGGQMARTADACGIQFRVLNASKGAAVHSSRAQIDMSLYQRSMQEAVSRQDNLAVWEEEVESLIVEENQVRGIRTKNREAGARCVVICPGTFLDGLLHRGLEHNSGGRINEPASAGLTACLKGLGFTLLRFKTGTCPRLDKHTIDFSRLKVQQGDQPPKPFSFFSGPITQRQVPCYLTYTNERTHKIILDNLDKSPLYAGIIKATGVRYCPSVEDKIVKFADKSRHQVFLEPQGLDVDEIYPNGLSTSLPEEVQEKIVHSIEGLGEAKILRYGYGIEHTVVLPTQLYPTLETKSVKNLFLAGQINGTTGYEEAAAQGLVAGINAALRAQGSDPLILDRASSYIGVLIDDLTTKGTQEPYRMFTSRVEYRLILREDNADVRLGKIGHELGLLADKEYKKVLKKQEAIKTGVAFLKANRIAPARGINAYLESVESAPLLKTATLEEILKRPQVTLAGLLGASQISLEIPESAFQAVEIEVKYAGFIQRQRAEVERFGHIEKIRLPEGLEYKNIPALSREIREKLDAFRPLNLGQASRISGVTPAAISILMVYLRKLYGQK